MMGLRYEKEAYKIRDELSQLLLLGPSAQISGPKELAQAYSEGAPLAAALSANIIGVGIGKSGPALRVEVRTIEDLSGEQEDFLRKQYPDFPKEQLEFKKVGKIVAQQPNRYIRPAPGGVSISHCKVNTFGTLGCWVRDDSGEQYILSNNHVLTDYINHAQATDEILQPGLRDRPSGRQPGDEIALFSRCIPIKFYDNRVDAAIAKVIKPKDVDRNIMKIGNIQGLRPKNFDLLDRQVQKFGRRTNHTWGTITAIDLTTKIQYDGFTAIFVDQIEIFGSAGRLFSDRGDSGSLILDEDNKAVALLFAGSTLGATYANTIENVLNDLSVSLVM